MGPGIGYFCWSGMVKPSRYSDIDASRGSALGRCERLPGVGRSERVLVVNSRALLDRFSWQGVAMVEYKVDSATGTPYLMEVNGRFLGDRSNSRSMPESIFRRSW